jgi:glycosyltransferase involved in cell wall biosynthesis
MLVSVITIVKNGMPFVAETIQSVINQDYESIEYIVIDSVSNDGTVEYVLSYKDKVTKFVSEKDLGIADAFNKGLGLASGDYIMFLNADDKFYKADVISSLASHAERNGYPTFLYGDCEVLGRNTGNKKYIASIKFNLDGLLKGLMPPHPSMLVHKSYFKKYGNFDLSFKIAMDFEWFIRGIKSSSIIHVPSIISSVRDGGISTRSQIKVISEIILALKKNRYLPSNFRLITLWLYFLSSYMTRLILTKLRIYKLIKKTG